MYDFDGGDFDEFGDPDATACANGDYNTFEEEQVFLDNEGADGVRDCDDPDCDVCERDWDDTDDSWMYPEDTDG